MMIPWQKHNEKGATDRQTDGQKEVFLRAARSQLKTLGNMHNNDTGLQLLSWEGSSALKRGKTLAIFSFDGKIPPPRKYRIYDTKDPLYNSGLFSETLHLFLPIQ